MSRAQPEHFVNRGFGWVCRKCGRVKAPSAEKARLLSEGESEAREPELSTSGLARWTNDERNEVECLKCGVSERIRDRR